MSTYFSLLNGFKDEIPSKLLKVGALALLSDSHERDPENIDLTNQLAAAFIREQKFLEAENLLLEMPVLNSNSFSILARIFCLQEKFIDAEETLLTGLHLYGHDQYLVIMLGHFYLNQNKISAFDKLVSDAADEHGHSSMFLAMVSKSAFLRGYDAEAARLSEAALKAAGKINDAHIILYLAATKNASASSFKIDLLEKLGGNAACLEMIADRWRCDRGSNLPSLIKRQNPDRGLTAEPSC